MQILKPTKQNKKKNKLKKTTIHLKSSDIINTNQHRFRVKRVCQASLLPVFGVSGCKERVKVRVLHNLFRVFCEGFVLLAHGVF